jgi:hypothetical protein
VKIDPGIDPTAVPLFNICEQREYLAQLIRALAVHEPAVIVVDKYFTPSGCNLDHPSTIALQQAVASVSQRIPIIVGVRINKDVPPIANAGNPAYEIFSPIRFPGSPKLKEGVINIDLDTRRLALSWLVVSDGEPVLRNTLALETAQAYDTRLFAKYPSINRLSRDVPYISLIRGEYFPSYLAGDILCTSRDLQGPLGAKCMRHKIQNDDVQYFRGRIALS